MSLSTLLEAAKYLDYLDSNKNSQQSQQQQQQQQLQQLHEDPQQNQLQLHHQFQLQQSQPTNAKKSNRRPRSSKKDAANTMVAMSLPASTDPIQMQHGVPIPLVGNNNNHHHHHHQAASLSSSFMTGSPLSSFASTALLCSKASGVTSASSSTASSLSSSDSSSSCGEILMGDADFGGQSSPMAASSSGQGREKHEHHLNNRNKSHLQQEHHSVQPTLVHKLNSGSSNGSNNQHQHNPFDSSQSFARYIAATSNGPQLVTMTTSSNGGFTSTSAPIDGRIRAGHVIQAANNNAGTTTATMLTGANFDPRQYSITTANGLQRNDLGGGHPFGMIPTGSLGSDNHLSVSPGNCPPLIMARVQPMILNSISPPSGHHNHHHQSGILAFQPATASSPTSSSSSYSRHRELHKTLEKNRRAHLRHCFELLKAELPASECVDKKTSHINIIKSAIRYVLALRQKECEIDSELQRLTKIKNELTEKLSTMRNDPQQHPLDLYQQPNQVQHQQQQQLSSNSVTNLPPTTSSSSINVEPTSPATTKATASAGAPGTDTLMVKQEQGQQQQLEQSSPHQPVAEQQLSFLLSQSKID